MEQEKDSTLIEYIRGILDLTLIIFLTFAVIQGVFIKHYEIIKDCNGQITIQTINHKIYEELKTKNELLGNKVIKYDIDDGIKLWENQE